MLLVPLCVVAGYLLGINPFDQPDVEAAKKAADRKAQQQAQQEESLNGGSVPAPAQREPGQ